VPNAPSIEESSGMNGRQNATGLPMSWNSPITDITPKGMSTNNPKYFEESPTPLLPRMFTTTKVQMTTRVTAQWASSFSSRRWLSNCWTSNELR
jgi:hypothetical protein